jgi:hypothetical protein
MLAFADDTGPAIQLVAYWLDGRGADWDAVKLGRRIGDQFGGLAEGAAFGRQVRPDLAMLDLRFRCCQENSATPASPGPASEHCDLSAFLLQLE